MGWGRGSGHLYMVANGRRMADFPAEAALAAAGKPGNRRSAQLVLMEEPKSAGIPKGERALTDRE